MDAVTIIALTDNQTAWWITLGAGLAVLVVVTVLLEILRRTVEALEKDIWAAWLNGKAVVRHTGTTYLLKNTRVSGEELVDELRNHG